MERGHSGAQQDSEREDINCAVRPLAAWLLRYCVITDLHRVIFGLEVSWNSSTGTCKCDGDCFMTLNLHGQNT